MNESIWNITRNNIKIDALKPRMDEMNLWGFFFYLCVLESLCEALYAFAIPGSITQFFINEVFSGVVLDYSPPFLGHSPPQCAVRRFFVAK